MRKTSNIGEEGVESIRLADMKIEDLPIRESAIAASQLPLAEATARQNRINDIWASRPKQKIEYLESRIKEAELNIARVQKMKAEQNEMISEYKGYITLCKFRDSEMSRLDKNASDYNEKLKELTKRFPLYNVEKMQEQIKLCYDSIDRADEVIAKEYQAITELKQLIFICRQKDIELRNLGVNLATG